MKELIKELQPFIYVIAGIIMGAVMMFNVCCYQIAEKDEEIYELKTFLLELNRE